jgi:HlyD family secretion protein
MGSKKKNTYRKVIIFSGIAVLLAGLGVYAYFRKPNVVITVQTEKVTRRNLTELVVANGKIQPVVAVKISPEVSGEIITLSVKEGQFVKKGDLLMRIKPDTYVQYRNIADASYKSAQAQMTVAKANLDRSELELKRYEELLKNKLVSDSQYNDTKTSFDVAKANYLSATHQTENARANLARAEEDLAKTTIVSPLDGTISKLNSQLGERVVGTATYQGTEVMTISDLNDMEARVDIGEVDVVLIKIGQKARMEVDSFRDRKFNGTVTEIANTAKTTSAGSQTEATKFEVKIRITEKESFRPGMSCTAEVETRYRTNVLTVPTQSVTTRMPKEDKGATNQTAKAGGAGNGANVAANTNATNATPTTQSSATGTNSAIARKPNEIARPDEVVFVVDNNLAKMKKVTRGISDEAYVEITEGLRENEDVITGTFKAINRELEDGKTVKVDNEKKILPTDKDKEEK